MLGAVISGTQKSSNVKQHRIGPARRHVYHHQVTSEIYLKLSTTKIETNLVVALPVK